MKKHYIVEYTVLYNNKRLYYRAKINSFCKLFALLKFKRCYKHQKSLKREILRVRRKK